MGRWLGLCALTLTFQGVASAATWNYTDDFQILLPQVGTGAGGVWWYAHAASTDDDGDYPLMTESSNETYVYSPNSFHLISNYHMHPGNFDYGTPGSNLDPDVLVYFRAPADGTYRVFGAFTDLDGTDGDGPEDKRGVRVSVSTSTAPGFAGADVLVSSWPTSRPISTATVTAAYLDASNTNPWMRALLNGAAPPSSFGFDFLIDMLEGQRVYFRAQDLGSSRFDSTGIEITITDEIESPDAGVAEVDSSFEDSGEPATDAGLPQDLGTIPNPPKVDAGDAGDVSDGGHPDAAPTTEASDGCSCRASGREHGASWVAMFLVFVGCLFRENSARRAARSPREHE
ncbi:MAG: hypothetical protein HY791_30630 [Deltaproteobacteria bacterium]|nr:hypothetical protein [Deltaproteobacteria bacterium]